MPAGVTSRDVDGEEPDQAVSAAGGALAVDAGDDAAVCGALFRGLVFYLGREVPREPLLLVLRAFGGVVGWEGDGSPLQESDEAITHQVLSILGSAQSTVRFPFFQYRTMLRPHTPKTCRQRDEGAVLFIHHCQLPAVLSAKALLMPLIVQASQRLGLRQ